MKIFAGGGGEPGAVLGVDHGGAADAELDEFGGGLLELGGIVGREGFVKNFCGFDFVDDDEIAVGQGANGDFAKAGMRGADEIDAGDEPGGGGAG